MFFRKKYPVRVDWAQQGCVHGLLRGSVILPAGASPQDLELSVDGRAVPIAPGEGPAGEPLQINVHTHLLENGERALALLHRSREAPAQASAPTQVEVRNEGPLADSVRTSLRRFGTPVAFFGDCDASRYDYADPQLAPWFDRPDAGTHVATLQADGAIDADEADLLRAFLQDGFVILRGALPAELVDRAVAEMDRAVADGYQGYRYGDSTRLEQMHVGFPAIRELWLLPRVHRMLGLIFDEVSEPCQSLAYVFGSQQDAHQDTIHLTPFPAGYMCGVWMALEDVRAGSGELMVYPGSHRLPRVYLKDTGCAKVRGDWSQFGATVVKRWEQLVAASGIAPQPYLAKRGDILIWHENLMHAGSLRRNPSLSRRSVVTHNFARGSLVYYDSTGAAGLTFPIEADGCA